jgi:hypothetical protein
MTQNDAAEVARSIGPNVKRVIGSLSGTFQPAPRSQSRQLTASVASRHSTLIQREWQDGCAQCTYYRLTPLGLQVRARLQGWSECKEAAAKVAEDRAPVVQCMSVEPIVDACLDVAERIRNLTPNKDETDGQ